MEKDWQRRKFKELRFEFYVSGRTLWFSDTMSIAAMLLGHSVELHLKQALIEHDVTLAEHKEIKRRHDLTKLYSICKENGVYDDVLVSDELIVYISDMLHQRYPSQSVEASIKAEERGHAISRGIGVIQAYDDLIIQFDDSLRRKYGDKEISLGVQASHFVNRYQGRAFFHCNIGALRNIQYYHQVLEAEYNGAEEKFKKEGQTPETIQYNLSSHKQRLETFKGAPNSIWIFNKLIPHFSMPAEPPTAGCISEGFVYPGKIHKIKPSTVIKKSEK